MTRRMKMKQNIYDNPTFFKEYTSLRESGLTYNDFLEQPAMKTAIGDINGMLILDLGCGMGDLSKYCADNGAVSVIAVDISEKMIERAKEENSDKKVEYLCQPIEDIELPAESFDLVISSLAIHYIADYFALIAKISKLLKEGGRLIFTTEHPIATAQKEMKGWVKGDKGEILHWPVDNYQEEGQRKEHWYVDGVIKYHRTVSTLINVLTEHGLTVEKVEEPLPTKEGLKKLPKLINEYRKPPFILIQSKKS